VSSRILAGTSLARLANALAQLRDADVLRQRAVLVLHVEELGHPYVATYASQGHRLPAAGPRSAKDVDLCRPRRRGTGTLAQEQLPLAALDVQGGEAIRVHRREGGWRDKTSEKM